MALSRLGAATIVAISDNTAEAKLCNTLFDDLADRVMIQGSWATTITRATLAQTANTPTFDFAYEFQLPTDPFCLKVLNIDEGCVGQTEYRIESDKLLTDSSSIKIRYIGRLTSSSDFGVALTEALESLLAAYLALPITGDKNLAMELRNEYKELINRNLAIDGQQGSKEQVSADDLIKVR